MAVGIVDRQKLVNIADAVRAKKGITGEMTLDAIASNITSIPTADNNAKFDFAGSGSSGKPLSYLTKIDLSGWDTSNVTDMNYMFSGCSSLTSLDVSNFNTGKVTDMSSMFQYCSLLTSLDVSNFNTGNVTDIGHMFDGCSSLTSLDVSSFNTSKVNSYSSFSYMFSGCSSLKTLDLSNFDFSNTYATPYNGLVGLFNECKSLETITFPSTVTFNNSGVSFSDMFKSCTSLTSLDLSGFNTTNVQYMKDMFNSCSKLSNLTLGTDWASNSGIDSFVLSSCPLTHESAVDVINKLATRSNSPVIKFNSKVGLYQSEIDVATNKGWSVSGCRVLVDAETATVGQYALIDGVLSKCVYVADAPQTWGQRIFASQSYVTYSNGNTSFEWGGNGTATGITAQDIGTGLSNTNSLIAMNLQPSGVKPTIWDAIKEFRNTHSDRWFIPSRNELGKIINNYTYSDIWSSTELNSTVSYASNLGYNPNTTTRDKTKIYSVLPFTYV